MKKLISMVLVATMVATLVPTVAFGANNGTDIKATAKIVGAKNFRKSDTAPVTDGTELQMEVTESGYTGDALSKKPGFTFTLLLDGAHFTSTDDDQEILRVYDKSSGQDITLNKTTDFTTKVVDKSKKAQEMEITIKDGVLTLDKNDRVIFGLNTTMNHSAEGKFATVTVESDDITISNGKDLTYATIEGKGITASVRSLVDIAKEEYNTIKDITVKPAVGKRFDFLKDGQEIRIKLNSSFEFAGTPSIVNQDGTDITGLTIKRDDKEISIKIDDANKDSNSVSYAEKMVFKGMKVEATSAKEGAKATLKFEYPGCDTVSLEVAKVVGNSVTMTVEKDKDLPIIYSGVDVKNTGITDSSDHKSLEVTIKESFPGAWRNNKDFTLKLPEGVYVVEPNTGAAGSGLSISTDGDFAVDTSYTGSNTTQKTADWIEKAYEKGNFETFEFKKRTWKETDPSKDEKAAELQFTLTLVADPNFEGDVILQLIGDGLEKQEVKIAKFVKPYTVEAQQNDLKVDYRNTEIPTSVIIKEAKAGLWDRNTEFTLALDKINFDDEGKITVDSKSGLTLKNDGKVKTKQVNGKDVLYFTIDRRSDDKPATVTLSDMKLYMDRSLPAGAYDLSVVATQNDAAYLQQHVLGYANSNVKAKQISNINKDFVDYTAKKGFVTIITAGREDSDSFTTKVTIPIGGTTIKAGEKEFTVDAPAYISKDYTMLPLRAVAVALGIPNNNVSWNQQSKTATVIYGSKIIVMTVDQRIMYVNGSPIPTSSAPEINKDRIFLPLRDLGTALGVSDLTWESDPATGLVKTVYLNAGK